MRQQNQEEIRFLYEVVDGLMFTNSKGSLLQSWHPQLIRATFQAARHCGTFQEEFRKSLAKYAVDYDERYVWE